MRISDWSSDVCSSDLLCRALRAVILKSNADDAGLLALFRDRQPITKVLQYIGKTVPLQMESCPGPGIELPHKDLRLPGRRDGADAAIDQQFAIWPHQAEFSVVFGQQPKIDRKSTRLNSSH